VVAKTRLVGCRDAGKYVCAGKQESSIGIAQGHRGGNLIAEALELGVELGQVRALPLLVLQLVYRVQGSGFRVQGLG